MQKRYLLIGALVITIALVISFFVWGNINKANGSLAGQSKALVVAGNRNGNSDFIPPSVEEVAAHAKNSTTLVTDRRGKRDFLSPGLQMAATTAVPAQPLIPVTGANFQPSVSPYLVAAAQYVDDHYPVLSGAYLTVVGTYHDR
jgi:hypothetical protein